MHKTNMYGYEAYNLNVRKEKRSLANIMLDVFLYVVGLVGFVVTTLVIGSYFYV